MWSQGGSTAEAPYRFAGDIEQWELMKIADQPAVAAE